MQVNEAAGSYLWHDHSGSNKADGLQGALIVHAKGPEPWTYDEERTIFLTDWFHGQFGSSLLHVVLLACVCLLIEWLICYLLSCLQFVLI